MRRTFSIGLFLAGFLLAACHGSSSAGSSDPSSPGASDPSTPNAPGSPDDPGQPATPPSAKLTVADPSGGTGPFAIGDLDKLVLAIDGADLKPGSHPVRVDVTGPGGTLYARLPATLVVGQDRKGHTTSTLQVRGSVIESFRDAGSWQLVVNVDGKPLAAASVDLTE